MTEEQIREEIKLKMSEAKVELNNPSEKIRFGKEQNNISLPTIKHHLSKFKNSPTNYIQELYNRALSYVMEHENILSDDELDDFDKTLKYLSALSTILNKTDFLAPCFVSVKDCGKLK